MGSSRNSLASVKARLARGPGRGRFLDHGKLDDRVLAVMGELLSMIQTSHDARVVSGARAAHKTVTTAWRNNIVVDESLLRKFEANVASLRRYEEKSHEQTQDKLSFVAGQIFSEPDPAPTLPPRVEASWGQTHQPETKMTQAQELDLIRRELEKDMGLKNGDPECTALVVAEPTYYPVPQPPRDAPIHTQLGYLIGRTWFRIKRRVFDFFTREKSQ